MTNQLLKKSLYFALAASTLAFGGCRKRGGTAASSPATPDSQDPSSSAPAAKGNFTATPAVPANSPAAKAHSEMDQKLASGNVQLQLQVLDDVLQAWVMSQNTIPKDLGELVRAKMLSKLPIAPPGTRFAVDQKTGRAVLVNL